MKAPEKIYVDSKAIGDNISTTIRTKRQDYPTCTEYIKTDTFIEKALKYITNHFLAPGMDNEIKDFVNYMKGG